MANDDVDCVALEMVGRFGTEAAHVARALAERAEECQRASAHAWHDIADAIERAPTAGATQQHGAENAE
jgi:hypothetical protein